MNNRSVVKKYGLPRQPNFFPGVSELNLPAKGGSAR